MTRRITLGVVLALLAAPVLADTLGDALDSLDGHLEARIDVIGPAPTEKALKKESKKLLKAREILDTWVGNNDIPDLKILGKVGIQILRSKTADEDIWQDVRDVVQALIDMAREKRGLGQDVLDRLYDEKHRVKVEKILAKADQHLDAAIELLQALPVQAHKSVVKAWKLYLKSVVKGEKLEQKAANSLPDHLFIQNSIFTFAIYNTSDKDHFIRDVRFTGEWKSYTTQDVYPVDDVSLAALWPDHFVVDVYQAGGITSWDCACMISRTYAGDPAQFVDLFQYVYRYKEEALANAGPLYFQGTILVVVSNRHTPGMKGEKIYRIPHLFTSTVYD